MSVTEVVHRYFPFLNQRERRLLCAVDASPRPSADGTALLLGHDLRIEPLRAFHDCLLATGDAAPPLWRFAWEPEQTWDATSWLALRLEARILRARAGSLVHAVSRHLDPQVLEMRPHDFAVGTRALEDAGMIRGDRPVLESIANGTGIAADVALVELIVHWLRMIAHRDRIVKQSPGNGFDVCGYTGACSYCRSRWGSIARAAGGVPPFHPGCRCFAQPRWAH